MALTERCFHCGFRLPPGAKVVRMRSGDGKKLYSFHEVCLYQFKKQVTGHSAVKDKR